MMKSQAVPLRYRLWIGIALAHLALMTLGAFSVNLSGFGPVGRVLDYYGALSGAHNSYGFFAPGVSGEIRALFDVTDASGATRTESLDTHASREADLRVGDIIDQFLNDLGDDDENKNLSRALAASLAGTVFGRHPEARSIRVRLESFTPVDLDEYRNGARPKWEPLYEAKFVHQAPGGSP